MKSQLFEHIKTRRVYRVIEVGKDTETHEDSVVYVCAAEVNSQVWIRSLDDFNQKFQLFDVNVKPEKLLARAGFGRNEIADYYEKLKSG
jgi:hypothetical protein